MGYKLSRASYEKLAGVNPLLVRVVERAIQTTPFDFKVTEGLRSATRQVQLVRQGKSRTFNSKHLHGDAVDIAVFDERGELTWKFDYYASVAVVFKRAAEEMLIPLVWGGDWEGFRDGPHFQIGG